MWRHCGSSHPLDTSKAGHWAQYPSRSPSIADPCIKDARTIYCSWTESAYHSSKAGSVLWQQRASETMSF